jgi:hypothetical protein
MFSVRITTHTRENAELVKERINTSKKIMNWHEEANGDIVITLKAGTSYVEMTRIVGGLTMKLEK